jgi:hypothetical protein
MTGTGIRRIALAVSIAAAVVAAPAQAAIDLNTPGSQPSDYISNYGGRAKPCPGLVTPPWVSWLTYSNATVSDEWLVYASSKQLCSVARRTADNAISELPFDDGAAQNLTLMLAYGLHRHGLHAGLAPRPAGRSWKCLYLPSFWGESAWDNARLSNHKGAPLPEDFAQASGPAAGAGLCTTGTHFDPHVKLAGGKFFTWAPDTTSCRRRYVLKEIPDPNNPGETTNPAFPANLWGDYDRKSC